MELYFIDAFLVEMFYSPNSRVTASNLNVAFNLLTNKMMLNNSKVSPFKICCRISLFVALSKI